MNRSTAIRALPVALLVALPALPLPASGAAVLAPADPAAGAAAPRLDRARLSPLGLGALRFGMTPEEATAALGARVRTSPAPHGCAVWRAPGLRRDAIQLLSIENRPELAFALVHGPGVRTTRGVAIGDGAGKLRRRYRGRLRRGRSGSLSAHMHLFVEFIGAGPRRVVETFGECA